MWVLMMVIALGSTPIAEFKTKEEANAAKSIIDKAVVKPAEVKVLDCYRWVDISKEAKNV